MKDQRDVRREYCAGELNRSDLDDNPREQFSLWLQQALEVGIEDATAMTLATADENGLPSARIVLLKHFDEFGFAWYTDYGSAKGHDLAVNPQAALLFYWPKLDRQVRLVGQVEKLPASEAEAYFHSRPLGSRLSAAASEQSRVVAHRSELEAKVVALEQQHPDGKVPRPERWGGYRLLPSTFEFWQGRKSRLHDRFAYRWLNNHWQVERLSP
ncbi:MAG: pyridoxamine 5'-phosphate oxidase [Gammaproteobacteria bacterium]|nr:pyridoxamine 5'-phosphate oxidase [Gammaproteobacteria bacterium]